MRISIVTLLLVAFSTFFALANIGKEQAEVIASEFVSQQSGYAKSLNKASEEVSLAHTEIRSEKASEDACYIFNIGKDDGFVIVSAFEKGPKILGYTDKGMFNYSSMPDNMKYWLQCVGEELSQHNSLNSNILPPPDFAKHDNK